FAGRVRGERSVRSDGPLTRLEDSPPSPARGEGKREDGRGSPLEAEHQAVQPAADAEEADAVAGPEELALLRDGRGDRQRHGADVAEVLERAEVLLRRDADRPQHRLAVAGADLVADHLVEVVAAPAELREELLPGAHAEF